MKKHLINIQNAQIEVLDSEGVGDAIFLLHGNSSSMQTFSALFDSSLAHQYRILGIHLPGHGNSRYEGDISTPLLAELIGELINHFSVKQYLLVGQSIGGHIFSHALPHLSHCKGLVLISAPPLSLLTMGEAFKPDPVSGALFTPELTQEQISLLADNLLGPEKNNTEDYNALVHAITHTEGKFRDALGQSLSLGQFSDEQEHLHQVETPVALIWGTEDAFINPDFYHKVDLPQPLGKGYYPFEGAGHNPHLAQKSRFIDLIEQFTSEVGLQNDKSREKQFID